MSSKAITYGYCSDCGEWSEDCATIVVYSIPEKVCKRCRDAR